MKTLLFSWILILSSFSKALAYDKIRNGGHIKEVCKKSNFDDGCKYFDTGSSGEGENYAGPLLFQAAPPELNTEPAEAEEFIF